ncbi:pantetheine-phosphate adenylyltransferase [Cumulibacter soli]|uniref:pantetheine-phosphate adenylyltransferase n=1 Tax=Cumulibacter soli TaxID=2546344 RepID=UPI001ABB7BD7|nr:pantetheine-phosphate adenylyltransferase [Cumulibacter soli]
MSAQPESSAPQSISRPIRRAVCPGSFDPLHNGHLDIIARAAQIFDEVIALSLVNPSKKTLFTLEERQQLVLETAAEAGLDNVRVDSMSGLLVDYCTQNNVSAIVKGLRVATDFDYEIQMSQMNHKIAGVETLFLTTNPEHSYISSSLVKEVATNGGDVRSFLSRAAYDALMKRLAENADA